MLVKRRPFSTLTQLVKRRPSRRVALVIALASITWLLYLQDSSFNKAQHQLDCYRHPPSLEKHRSFLTRPVTNEEHRVLSERDIYRNVTTAICHPTLFGSAKLERFYAFISYHRLLGFDHIFAWYEPNLNWTEAQHAQLQNLSYVTMTEYQGGKENYWGQVLVAKACRGDERYAKNYDWVYAVDADEFLWLGQNRTLKEFIMSQNPSIGYISFGKWQYGTLVATSSKQDSGFGLDRFSFTPRLYCYRKKNWGNCPDWWGRCKILARPRLGANIPVHGSASMLRNGIHYNSSQAHVKEWSGMTTHAHDEDRHLEIRNASYRTNNNSLVGVLFFTEAYPLLADGTVQVYYDEELESWLRVVAANLPSTA